MKETASRFVALAGLALLAVGLMVHSLGSFRGTAALFVSGGVLIAAAAALNFRAVAAFSKTRSARHGANSLLVTILFTAILVVVQAISVRNTHRYDLTRNKRFTLSEQTVNLLERVRGEVKITGFFKRNTSRRQEAEDLLGLYAARNDEIRYELVDPDQKPHIADVMRAGDGDVIVEHKSKRRVLDVMSEEKLTNAIMLVTREEQKAIYFVTGHDEKDLSSRDRHGYQQVKLALEEQGYVARELSLVEAGEIPNDCTVLVIAGPKRPYLKSEAEKISTYLDAGGNAMFLLDPRRPVPLIQEILGRYRVALDDLALLDEFVVVDAGDQIYDATVTKIRRYEKHAITKDFRVITLYPMARPVRIVPDPGRTDAAVSAQYLAVTERSAWGETDLDGFRAGTASRDTTDVQGPLPVSLAAEREIVPEDTRVRKAPSERNYSRIVVVGDSDFIANSFFGLLGNGDFFLNAVSYLAEDDDLIEIRAKKGLGDQIFITVNQGRLIFALCLILLPLSVVSTGVYVFLKKRKA